MANIKSAIKRIRTTRRNRERNRTAKASLKSMVKKAADLISSKSEDAIVSLKETLRKIDKIVAKGIMHKKTAARKKSRLMKKLSKAGIKK